MHLSKLEEKNCDMIEFTRVNEMNYNNKQHPHHDK